VEHDLWSEVLIIAEHDPKLQGKLADRRLELLSRGNAQRSSAIELSSTPNADPRGAD